MDFVSLSRNSPDVQVLEHSTGCIGNVKQLKLIRNYIQTEELKLLVNRIRNLDQPVNINFAMSISNI